MNQQINKAFKLRKNNFNVQCQSHPPGAALSSLKAYLGLLLNSVYQLDGILCQEKKEIFQLVQYRKY